MSLVDCEAVLLCVADCVSEHVGESLPLTSGEYVVVVEGLGLGVCVAAAVTVVEEVGVLDKVCVSALEIDCDGDEVSELLVGTVMEAVAVTVLDADLDGVPDRERVTLGDTLELAPGDNVEVGVPVDVCEGVGVTVGVFDVVA